MYVCGLWNDIIISHTIAPNDWVSKSGWERTWKKAVIAHFKGLSRHLVVGTEKIHETPLCIVGIQSEILNRKQSNKCQKFYCFNPTDRFYFL
jgi:hypothetical protein